MALYGRLLFLATCRAIDLVRSIRLSDELSTGVDQVKWPRNRNQSWDVLRSTLRGNKPSTKFKRHNLSRA